MDALRLGYAKVDESRSINPILGVVPQTAADGSSSLVDLETSKVAQRALEEQFFFYNDCKKCTRCTPAGGAIQSNATGYYIIPNELRPAEIIPHLQKVEKFGVLLSVGAERALFDLVLMDPEKCRGLVVRDLDPNVQKYVQFNVLLLKIAKDLADYNDLSSLGGARDFEKKCDSLRERITCDIELTSKMKDYYLSKLKDLAHVYFIDSDQQSWRSHHIRYSVNSFEGVRYFEEPHLFYRLQNYAKAGNIVATVGCIDDLEFLAGYDISVIDVSNVPEYFNLKFTVNSPTIIISTKVDFNGWVYTSQTL